MPIAHTGNKINHPPWKIGWTVRILRRRCHLTFGRAVLYELGRSTGSLTNVRDLRPEAIFVCRTSLLCWLTLLSEIGIDREILTVQNQYLIRLCQKHSGDFVG